MKLIEWNIDSFIFFPNDDGIIPAFISIEINHFINLAVTAGCLQNFFKIRIKREFPGSDEVYDVQFWTRLLFQNALYHFKVPNNGICE